jgi:hypothetical protein
MSFGNLTEDIFLAALDEIIALLQKNQTDCIESQLTL